VCDCLVRAILGVVNDTTPAAQRRYDELLRGRSPAERLTIAMSLSRAIRRLAVAGIKAAHPNASSREVEAQLAARLYGAEIAKRLFGHRAG
jgi:methionine aminopeptidase